MPDAGTVLVQAPLDCGPLRARPRLSALGPVRHGDHATGGCRGAEGAPGQVPGRLGRLQQQVREPFSGETKMKTFTFGDYITNPDAVFAAAKEGPVRIA